MFCIPLYSVCISNIRANMWMLTLITRYSPCYILTSVTFPDIWVFFSSKDPVIMFASWIMIKELFISWKYQSNLLLSFLLLFFTLQAFILQIKLRKGVWGIPFGTVHNFPRNLFSFPLFIKKKPLFWENNNKFLPHQLLIFPGTCAKTVDFSGKGKIYLFKIIIRNEGTWLEARGFSKFLLLQKRRRTKETSDILFFWHFLCKKTRKAIAWKSMLNGFYLSPSVFYSFFAPNYEDLHYVL